MILTSLGKQEVDKYLAELKAKRKEILDAKLDTCEETVLPNYEDVEQDIEWFEEDNEYYNTWGVSDNYNADYPLSLKRNIHYN